MKTRWRIVTASVAAFVLTGIAFSQQKPAAEKAMREKKHAVKPEEHRAKAVEHQDELKSEIEEPSPDGQKIIEDVAAVQREPTRAQAKRKAMRTERRVGEAEPPQLKK